MYRSNCSAYSRHTLHRPILAANRNAPLLKEIPRRHRWCGRHTPIRYRGKGQQTCGDALVAVDPRTLPLAGTGGRLIAP